MSERTKKMHEREAKLMSLEDKALLTALGALLIGGLGLVGYEHYKNPPWNQGKEPVKEKVGASHELKSQAEMPSSAHLKKFAQERGITFSRK